MNKRFWRIMVLITIVSLIMTFVFGSDIPWNNLKNITFSWTLTKEILYDISVGVFSSMILVWCIDRIQQRETEKQNAKQRLILYSKLAPVLKKYYEFYLCLFIATRNDPVEEESKVLESLSYCKEEFITQIRNTNPFYKDGYYIDNAKYCMQRQLLEECGDDEETLNKIRNMNISMSWYQCWCEDGTEFYNDMSQIEKDYITLFPNELLENVNELLNIVMRQKNMRNYVEGNNFKRCSSVDCSVIKWDADFFIYTYEIEKVLKLLNSIMQYIENDSSLELRKRELKFFNERNVFPQIGESCNTMKENVFLWRIIK